MFLRMVTLITMLGIIISSCNQATSLPTATLIPTGQLTPYHTSTPGPVLPTATRIINIPITPAPTSTPFTHTVKKDETMLGIAFQYGLSLEDLKAANPGVDPRIMSVGLQLVIPLGGEISETIPTATPVPVNWLQPDCYRTGDGGAWCILVVKNQLENSVENLSGWIGLYTPQGTIISSHVAYSPLNMLRPGDTMPLMTYFSPPLPENFEAFGELLSGIVVAADDTRYLNLDAKVDQVEISTDGRQAMVSGEVLLPDGVPVPAQIWIMIIAYDLNGTLIGGRKWESSGETQFTLPIFSLAGMIDHVDVLTEARP